MPFPRRGRVPLNRTLQQTQPDLSRNRERETSTQILAYPTGERDTSVILLEKRFPTQARLNKPYTYELKVTNLTDWPISGVVVREDFPASFTVAPADAEPGTARETGVIPPPAERLPEAAKPPAPSADSGPEPALVVPPGGTSAATSRPA